MKNELKVTLLIGTSFALVFFAFATIQSLNVALFASRGMAQLGFINLAIVYVVFAFVSTQCHKFFDRFGLKSAMMLGVLWYFTYTVAITMAFFVPINWIVWVFVCVAACIVGTGAGLFWVGQGTYMSLVLPEDIKSYYMGIFYGMFASSGITGSLVSAFLFTIVSPEYVVGILAIVCICGIIPLFGLDSIDYVKAEETENVSRPSPGIMIPLYIYTGIWTGVAYGIFPFYLDATIDSQNLFKLAIIQMFTGVGQTSAAVTHGKIAQWIGDVPVLIIALTYFTICVVLISICLNFSFGYYWIPIALIVGASDGGQFGVLNKIISMCDKTEFASFQKYRCFNSFGSFVMFLLGTWLVPFVPNWLLFVCALILNFVGSMLAIHLYRSKISNQLSELLLKKDASLITIHGQETSAS